MIKYKKFIDDQKIDKKIENKLDDKIEKEIENKLEEKKSELKIKINEFLSNYSRQRNLDSIFSKWIYLKDNSNTSRTVLEWKNLFQNFLNEK